jgi:hypothetical protein
MGYAGFSLKKITRAFWPVARRGGRQRSWHAEARDCSWDEFSCLSDFLQSIVCFIAMAVVDPRCGACLSVFRHDRLDLA